MKMARSKIDPQGAVRDMFGKDQQAEPKLQATKVQKAKPSRVTRSNNSGLASKFLTVEDVAQRYGVSKATVWRWVKNDPDFPEPIKLSIGTSRWTEEQLLTFERLAAKRSASKAKGQTGVSGARVDQGVAK